MRLDKMLSELHNILVEQTRGNNPAPEVVINIAGSQKEILDIVVSADKTVIIRIIE